MTVEERKPDFKLTTDTLYLTGELWVSVIRIMWKIDRVITAPHCIFINTMRYDNFNEIMSYWFFVDQNIHHTNELWRSIPQPQTPM